MSDEEIQKLTYQAIQEVFKKERKKSPKNLEPVYKRDVYRLYSSIRTRQEALQAL